MRILPATAASLGRIDPLIGEVPTRRAVLSRCIVPDTVADRAALDAVPGRTVPDTAMGSVAPYAVVAGNAAVSIWGDTSTVAGIVTANGAASRISGVNPHASVTGLVTVAAVTAFRIDITAAVDPDVRVELVRLPRPIIDILAKRLGLCGLLVRLLAQTRSFNLRLLCIRPGTRRFRFALAGVEFPVLGLAANFRSLLAMLIVPLLLIGLSAPSRDEQQQHNQNHRNNSNYHPDPWSCFQITHHFPLDASGRGCALRLTLLAPFITGLARVLTFY